MKHFVLNRMKDFKVGFQDDPGGDPTWLSFSITFNFDNEMEEETALPKSPLLYRSESNDDASTVSRITSAPFYLRNKGLRKEENYLHEFVTLLRELESRPWFFQSIGGLNTLWANASNVDNNYRGKDAELTIGTLESLDLRITRLADLYRKSVYDTLYMREMIPDYTRYFNMTVHIAEFRRLRDLMKLSSAMGNGYFEKNMSYMSFDCRMCEFDFSESFAPGDDISVHLHRNEGFNNNSFKIRVGHFMEKHNYPWFQISDTKERWVRNEVGFNDNKVDLDNIRDRYRPEAVTGNEQNLGKLPEGPRNIHTLEGRPGFINQLANFVMQPGRGYFTTLNTHDSGPILALMRDWLSRHNISIESPPGWGDMSPRL